MSYLFLSCTEENVISKELKELEDKNSFIVNIFNDIENDQLESF